ncbi:hypothetical protein Hanom_Chr04g00313051 [Helianthus anomalus]
MADPEINNHNSDENVDEDNVPINDNVFVSTMDRPESVASNVYKTPNGTRYWTPTIPPGFKPFVKARFSTIEQASAMYEEYAPLVGFGTCLGTSQKEKIGDEIIGDTFYALGRTKTMCIC